MIEQIRLEQAQALDAFVQAHPRGHFMQSSLWGRVKQGWPWTAFLLQDERTGEIRGSLALLRHDLRHLPGCCFFYAPRGPICDDAASFRALVEAAAGYARAHGAYLLRIDPEISETDTGFAALAAKMGFHINQAQDFSLFQPRLCYLSDLRGKDAQSLQAGYRRSTRSNIRKALRGPLTVRRGDRDDLPAFCRMMAKTGAKNGFTPRPRSYFQALLDGLGAHARLYLAELSGRPVAAAISVIYARTCSFCYGCSEEAGDKLHANELLQWEMQNEAIALGCERFDFRGVEGPPEESNPHYGLHRYKQGFGAAFTAWIGQLDLPLRPLLYTLVEHLAVHRFHF